MEQLGAMRGLKLVLLLLTAVLLAGLLMTRFGVSKLEDLHPPVGKTLRVDGVALHYVDRGSGPTLVLLHGASTSLGDFLPSLLPRLQSRYRVIAFDRPGHGYSDRPAGQDFDPAEQARLFVAALSELDVTDSVWIGHSWAGSVVLAGMLDYPQQVAGGVLLAGASHPWSGGIGWHNALIDTPLLGPLAASTLLYPLGQLLLPSAVDAVFAPNPAPPDYADATAVALTLRPAAARANADDLNSLSEFLSLQQRRYSQLRQPLLLIWGENDTIVPAWNHAERLLKQVPHARLITLPETGHAPHHARAGEVALQIDTFAAMALAAPR